MKLHLIFGVFVLFFILCAAAYMVFGPQNAPAAAKLPGEAVSGEPVRTATGVKFYDMKAGTGPTIPSDTSTVRVKYAGYLLNGSKFDSNDSASFGLNQVIKGWPDGMKGMKVGGKRKLVIPPEHAYGNTPRPKIPAGSTLVFDIELLGIEPDAQQTPVF